MSTPQPPYGFPEQTPPASNAPTAPHGYPAQAGPQSPPPPAPPERKRPGSLMPVLALVFAIIGLIVVSLGYASFAPGIGTVLGGVSFAGWLFIIAGLVLAIVALVRRAAAKGVSIAALVISIIGGLAGIGSVIVFVTASFFNFANTMVDEYGDLVPENPDDYFEMPEGSEGSDGFDGSEGSVDADVQADCDVLFAAAPDAMNSNADLSQLFDDLARQMSTEQVREPLEDLADAYEELLDMDDPGDAAEAAGEHQRAAQELYSVCGLSIDELQ